MIPVANYYDNEQLALDELSGKFFLAVRVDYKMVTEGVSVQVPDEVMQAYSKRGREGLLPFASEVESDYRRYRFYNHDGDATFPHIRATQEQDEQLFACFKKCLSLLEVEVIRLLYLLDSNTAKMHINYLYSRGYSLPLDIFCLGVSFFYKDPLTNIHKKVLRENPAPEIVIQNLQSNPLYGCPDAALMLLGAVARLNNPSKEIFHLKCLKNI
ncbi:MAG TPA: hypothetical protein VN030_12395, partial [Cellvibrio sp.]|nr:hypothetical protein [Cellvibrio sp.]